MKYTYRVRVEVLDSNRKGTHFDNLLMREYSLSEVIERVEDYYKDHLVDITDVNSFLDYETVLCDEDFNKVVNVINI